MERRCSEAMKSLLHEPMYATAVEGTSRMAGIREGVRWATATGGDSERSVQADWDVIFSGVTFGLPFSGQ